MVIIFLLTFKKGYLTMKKVYLLGFIMAATAAHMIPASANVEGAVAVAPAAPGCPKAFQGFHLGGNIGYGIGWVKHRFNETSGFRNDLAARGVDGGVGVGYTHRVCNWALRLAFDANWANAKGRLHRDEFADSFKVRLRNSLQLYGALGYVLREIAMPYIALGWDNSQWKATLADSSKSKRLNGFLWKLGVDFLATKHVVVGFEYTGVTSNKIKRSDEFNNRVHAKPQYNKFALTAKIVY
jgi:opacity protein-like surface antigen